MVGRRTGRRRMGILLCLLFRPIYTITLLPVAVQYGPHTLPIPRHGQLNTLVCLEGQHSPLFHKQCLHYLLSLQDPHQCQHRDEFIDTMPCKSQNLTSQVMKMMEIGQHRTLDHQMPARLADIKNRQLEST